MNAQGRFRHVTGKGEPCDPVEKRPFADIWILGILRQIGYTLDRGVDIGCRLLHVSSGFELKRDGAAALPGIGDHPVDPVDETDFRFDDLNDIALHILGTGARPIDGYADGLDLERWEKLGVDATQRKDAEDDHQHHQQVCCVGMPGKQAYDAAASRNDAAVHGLDPASVSVRT